MRNGPLCAVAAEGQAGEPLQLLVPSADRMHPLGQMKVERQSSAQGKDGC